VLINPKRKLFPGGRVCSTLYFLTGALRSSPPSAFKIILHIIAAHCFYNPIIIQQTVVAVLRGLVGWQMRK